jgi:hypothetical protein
LKKTERILKSRLSPGIWEITLLSPKILMDITRNKACDRKKKLPAIKQAGH